MQTEITKELRARVFGLYLGAEVYDTYHKENATLIRVGIGTLYCVQIRDQTTEVMPHEVQLLLHKPENITDADAIEVYNIDCDPETIGMTRESIKIKTVRKEIENNAIGSFKAVDLLRSKSYHIPYLGINLFDAGIAIEKPSPVK